MLVSLENASRSALGVGKAYSPLTTQVCSVLVRNRNGGRVVRWFELELKTNNL